MRVLFLLIILFTLPTITLAEENRWTSSFYFENDMFIGTDSDYTNGIKYSLISPDLSPHIPLNRTARITRLFLDFFHRLPVLKNVPQETGYKIELAIGQNMFTPKDISRTDLIENDRPYAGYLYLASAYHRKSDSGRSWSQMDTTEVQIGIIGPSSLAEDAQKFVHRVRDLQRPNGWEHQLKDELGVLLAFERKWLYHPCMNRGFCADAISHAGVAMGNVMTYINAGGEVRFGWNIPRNFAVSMIRPAGSTWISTDSGFSSYVFAAVNGKAVLRDIFLDGNTFKNSHHVGKEPLVAEFSTGLTTRYRQLSISAVYTRTTREFKGQAHSHGFGSLTLNYAF